MASYAAIELFLADTTASSGESGDIIVDIPVGAWTEKSTFAGLGGLNFYAALPEPQVGQWITIEITDLYNQWKSGELANNGIVLSDSETSSTPLSRFYSSDYAGNPSLRPKLVVYGSQAEAQISGTFSGTLNEDKASISGAISITGPGPLPPSFAEAESDGVLGSLKVNKRGTKWTYTLDADAQKLDLGDIQTDTIFLTASNGATQQFDLNVKGRDDHSVALGQTNWTVGNAITELSGNISLFDPDEDDTNPTPVDTSSANALGTLQIAVDGGWTYQVNENLRPSSMPAIDRHVVPISDGSQLDFEFTIEPIASALPFAETGTLSLLHTPSTVTLQRIYDNPVVMAYVATENGAQPVTVRVGNVSGNSLTLQLQEPDYLDGAHTNETVNYMVVEAGSWVLPDGTLLEAGTLKSNQLSTQGFDQVAFDAEFATAPIVISQVQTLNGAAFVTTRQRNADADGFEVTMQEEQAGNSGGHTTERLGWVAVEDGSGTSNGINWIAGRASGISETNTTVGLGDSLTGVAKVVAALSSFNGADPAWARGNGSTKTTFDVSAEEEASFDAEINHTNEAVDYFAFDGTGSLISAPIQEVMETGTLELSDAGASVTLARSYKNPVVIAFVATENEEQPVNVRISTISGDTLNLQLQEPDNLDGSHIDETVNYMVVEAGAWIMPDGTILEAGTLNANQLTTQGFESVAFNAAFDEAPVVLSHVQTFNGGAFVSTRQRNIDANGFEVTMQEEQAGNSGGHTTERLGWVAIEPGSGAPDGINWNASSTTGVTDGNAAISLGTSMPNGAHVIAVLSSFSGKDPAWARGNGSTDTTFNVSLEEDTSVDSETDHMAETVDHFAFEETGIVSAYDYDFFI